MKKLLPVILGLALSSSAFAYVKPSNGEAVQEAKRNLQETRRELRQDKQSGNAGPAELKQDRQAVKRAQKRLDAAQGGGNTGQDNQEPAPYVPSQDQGSQAYVPSQDQGSAENVSAQSRRETVPSRGHGGKGRKNLDQR